MVIQPPEIDRRQLVDHHATFELLLAVYQFDDARIIQSERRAVYVLPVGIVSHAKNLRFLGVVDVECKVVSRHDPVELR